MPGDVMPQPPSRWPQQINSDLGSTDKLIDRLTGLTQGNVTVEPRETEGDDGEMEHEQTEKNSEIQRKKAERERRSV